MQDTTQRRETDEETARRAYDLWEKEGRPEGRDKQHWWEAQRRAAGAGGAETPESYGRGELPGAGEPARGTGLEEANEQPGEGVPETRRDDRQPIAPAPDEPDAGGPDAAVRRNPGARTGP
jgi:hypothetical protein